MTPNIRKRFQILAITIVALFLSVWLEFFLQRKQYFSAQDTNRIWLVLLLNLHIVIIVVLLYLIIRQSIKIFVESSRRVPGSAFKKNLLFAFTVFSVTPTFLVFFIAGKLVTASINDSYLLVQNRLNKNSGKFLDYKQFKSTRNPVYWSYLFTFILVTLLILFLSIWCAFYLARGISRPIQEILKATEKIKHGHWDVNLSYDPTSDLKNLAIGFNQMTKALQHARTQLQQKNKEMLMILENIKEAVFFVNSFGRILTYNSASKILVEKYLGIQRFKNKKISFLGNQVSSLFFDLAKEFKQINKKHYTKEITFTFKGETKTLLVHVTLINNSFLKSNFEKEEKGLLIIIEDLTDIMKINKIKTWQEAAKQMAHEVKNPLTPIQLATQRLQRKYRNSLEKEQVFLDCTNTILNHVKIIKDLITHFSEFGRMPSGKIESIDLNGIIKEVVCLYQVSYPEIDFIYELQEFIPLIKLDKKKIKRVIINFIDNSIKAFKQENKNNSSQLTLKRDEKKFVKIKTSFKTGLNQIELLISDNGPGIPTKVKDKLFLPYVSSAKKNMGLGLAIIHETITKAGGSVKLIRSQKGATFQVLLPS